MSTDLTPGIELAGYRIDRLIGRGGMSVVYLAEHTGLKRKVALKLLASELASDDAFRKRFVRESELAASLDHPNIIPIYEAGDSGGHLYIAMRYVEGQDLKSIIRQDGPLPPDRALAICAQVASALDAAHRKGLVHRDVKPANVLLAAGADPSDTEHAYVSDFGLTKRASSESGLTGTGRFMGTLDYASPEQIRGDTVDGRTDQYSLTCLLFECLTGKVPFDRDSEVAVLYAHLNDPPPRPSADRPELPAALDDVVAKGMAKDPAERYESCWALVRAAREALGLALGAPLPASTPGRIRRVPRSRALALSGVALAVVIALAAILFSRDGGSPTTNPKGSASPGTAALAAVDRVVRVDPTTGRTIQTIETGKGPTGVAIGEGSVWVADSDEGTLSRVDPVSGKATRIHMGGDPESITVHEGDVWVVDRRGKRVIRIDPATNRVVARIATDLTPYDVAASDNAVWVVTFEGQTVGGATAPNQQLHLLRIDPRTNTLQGDQRFKDVGAVALRPVMAASGDFVWLGTADGGLRRVETTTGSVTKVTLKGRISDVAVTRQAVWVAIMGTPGTILKLDPGTAEVESRIPSGGGTVDLDGTIRDPIQIASDGTDVWVTDASNGSISRILSVSDSSQPPIPVGKTIRDLAVGLGAVWVTETGRD